MVVQAERRIHNHRVRGEGKEPWSVRIGRHCMSDGGYDSPRRRRIAEIGSVRRNVGEKVGVTCERASAIEIQYREVIGKDRGDMQASGHSSPTVQLYVLSPEKQGPISSE